MRNAYYDDYYVRISCVHECTICVYLLGAPHHTTPIPVGFMWLNDSTFRPTMIGVFTATVT